MTFPLEIQHHIFSYLPYTIVSKLSVYIPFVCALNDDFNLLTTQYTERFFSLFEKRKFTFSPYRTECLLYSNIDKVIRYVLMNINLKEQEDCQLFNIAYKASQFGFVNIIKTCIEGDSIHNYNCYLAAASKAGHLNVVEALIHNVDKSDLNSCCYCSNGTPLSLAAEKGHIDIVKKLIKENAKFYYMSVKCAASAGHFDIVELLIKHGRENIDFEKLKDEPYFYKIKDILKLID